MGIFIHSVDDSVTMESKRGERECVCEVGKVRNSFDACDLLHC
jgi:hypothetical protein